MDYIQKYKEGLKSGLGDYILDVNLIGGNILELDVLGRCINVYPDMIGMIDPELYQKAESEILYSGLLQIRIDIMSNFHVRETFDGIYIRDIDMKRPVEFINGNATTRFNTFYYASKHSQLKNTMALATNYVFNNNKLKQKYINSQK